MPFCPATSANTKNSADKTATKLPKPPSPPCAIIKKSVPSCAARMPSRAKPRLPHSSSAEAPTSAKSKTCSTKKKPSFSAASKRAKPNFQTTSIPPPNCRNGWWSNCKNILATKKSSPSAAASTKPLRSTSASTRSKPDATKCCPCFKPKAPMQKPRPIPLGASA